MTKNFDIMSIHNLLNPDVNDNKLSYEKDYRVPCFSFQNNDRKTIKRKNFDPIVKSILKDWLFSHEHNPYPQDFEKKELANKTGLTVNQISLWFVNARRRILFPNAIYRKSF